VYTVQSLKISLNGSAAPRIKLLLLVLFLCTPFLCQCHVWKAHKTMKEVRLEVEEEQKLEMDETAAYHLDAALGLLDAAEKQYEDADFTSATELAIQAEEQLDRSRKLRAFHNLVEPEVSGGSN
jgi:hypothetical protein